VNIPDTTIYFTAKLLLIKSNIMGAAVYRY